MYLFCINLGITLQNFVHLQRQIIYDGSNIIFAYKDSDLPFILLILIFLVPLLYVRKTNKINQKLAIGITLWS